MGCTHSLYSSDLLAPQDGYVIAWIDLAGLLPDNQKINASPVLNGIACDAQHDRLSLRLRFWIAIRHSRKHDEIVLHQRWRVMGMV